MDDIQICEVLHILGRQGKRGGLSITSKFTGLNPPPRDSVCINKHVSLNKDQTHTYSLININHSWKGRQLQ